jgi:hypothetical protein
LNCTSRYATRTRSRLARLGRPWLLAACASLGTTLATPSYAQLVAKGDAFMIGYGPHVIHFDPSPEHVRWNHFVALELQTDRTRTYSDRATFGLALFNNSFGQFSQYLYWGQVWNIRPLGGGELFGKFTVGLLNGYKPPYDDKIPFNKAGIAPAIVPSIGYRYDKVSGEVALLGFNGLLFAVSYTFDPF